MGRTALGTEFVVIVKKKRQSAYKVTLRHVCATIIAV